MSFLIFKITRKVTRPVIEIFMKPEQKKLKPFQFKQFDLHSAPLDLIFNNYL